MDHKESFNDAILEVILIEPETQRRGNCLLKDRAEEFQPSERGMGEEEKSQKALSEALQGIYGNSNNRKIIAISNLATLSLPIVAFQGS